jgi:hypothetical protein
VNRAYVETVAGRLGTVVDGPSRAAFPSSTGAMGYRLHVLPAEPPSDAEVARELAAIAQRLAALTTETDHDALGAELANIRAQLRLLGESNAKLGAWLDARLGPGESDEEIPPA